MFWYIVSSEGWDDKYRNYMWLLKWVGWIVCPIIVCHYNNCIGVVIGVCN